MVEGAAYQIMIYASLWFLFLGLFNINISILYLLMATVFLVYPINGFLADVCCGRFKTVLLCLCLMVFTLLIVFLALNILRSFSFNDVHNIVYTICLIGFLTFAISSTGYQANYIQFGLDQLLETPSRHQALFVHWVVWCTDMLSGMIVAVGAIIDCGKWSWDHAVITLVAIIGGCSGLLLLLLLVTCYLLLVGSVTGFTHSLN